MTIDNLLFSHIHQAALSFLWFDAVVIFLAKYLPFAVVAFLFVFLIYNFKKYRFVVLASLLSGGLASVITAIIRLFVIKERPFIAQNIVPLLTHAQSNSFPSLHASFFFGVSTVILLNNKKAGLAFFATSVLIVSSRVIAGLHWPSDILAGLALGILCGLLVQKLLTRFLRERGGKLKAYGENTTL